MASGGFFGGAGCFAIVRGMGALLLHCPQEKVADGCSVLAGCARKSVPVRTFTDWQDPAPASLKPIW